MLLTSTNHGGSWSVLDNQHPFDQTFGSSSGKTIIGTMSVYDYNYDYRYIGISPLVSVSVISTNFGADWLPLSMPTPPDTNYVLVDIPDFVITDNQLVEQVGIATNSDSTASLYFFVVSHDAGKTWQWPDFSTGSPTHQIYFMGANDQISLLSNPNASFANNLGQYSYYYQWDASSDGLQVFETAEGVSMAWVNTLDPFHPGGEEGYVSTGFLISSIDGGATWTTLCGIHFAVATEPPQSSATMQFDEYYNGWWSVASSSDGTRIFASGFRNATIEDITSNPYGPTNLFGPVLCYSLNSQNSLLWRTIPGVNGPVYCNPDGSRLAAVADQKLWLADVELWAEIGEMDGSSGTDLEIQALGIMFSALCPVPVPAILRFFRRKASSIPKLVAPVIP